MTEARHIKPGDLIIHPITDKRVMVRTTIWTGHTVAFQFYGDVEDFSASKTTKIERARP